MSKPHIFVADWLMPEFTLEQQAMERVGATWSMPGWRPPPPGKEVQHAELLQRIAATPRIDAVLFQLAPLDAEVIAALPPGCKLLQRMGIGLDNVDRRAAESRGIRVGNTPAYCIEEVAIQAMAMLLALHRQLTAVQQNLLAGRWSDTTPRPLERLSTLTLGLVGLGRIGRRLGEMLSPMVDRVLYHDPAVQTPTNGWISTSLDDLLRQSDLISLHCPLLSETRHLINAETLSSMKATAILVNVARGGLIDAVALASALNDDRLAGAGLDVYEPEVLPADSPLRNCKNTLLTSHTAWYSRQAVLDARTDVIRQILEVI